MYYYEVKDSFVEKYLITFNPEQIQLIREEIARKCSFKRKGKMMSTDFNAIPEAGEVFENIEGIKIEDNTEGVYYYQFDIVNIPKLVQLIDDLLVGDVQAYYQIKNYVVNDRNFDEEIFGASKDLVESSSNSSTNKSQQLDKLEELLELKELNADIEPMQPYYEALMNSIDVQFIGRLRIEKIDEVASFLNSSWEIVNGEFKLISSEEKEKQFIKE